MPKQIFEFSEQEIEVIVRRHIMNELGLDTADSRRVTSMIEIDAGFPGSSRDPREKNYPTLRCIKVTVAPE